jgi:hypothetical protein
MPLKPSAILSTNGNGHVNGVHNRLADLLGPAGEKAWEELKHKPYQPKPEAASPPQFAEPTKPAPDFLEDHRNIAKLLAALQHDTPERRALLKLVGLEANAISSRLIAFLANDLLKEVNRIQAEEKVDLRPWETCRDTPHKVAGLNTRTLSDVHETPVEWLWNQRLPLGKLSMISGDPDLGKTWLILDLIARITTGREMPDGSPNPFRGQRRDALWASTEDDDSDTIKKRFRMLGGDPSRFHSLQFVFESGNDETLNLGRHRARLEEWLYNHPLVAVAALDPIQAFLGKTDSHHVTDSRALLTPLSRLASRYRVAIIGNNHLNKDKEGGKALYRSIGSIAFVAAARSAWLVAADPNEPKDRRLFLKVKNNLAEEDAPNLAFRVGKAHNGISWEKDEVATTADEALAGPDTRAPARAEAQEWLEELLKEGPMPAADVLAKAKADGLNRATLFAAKKKLSVASTKIGGSGDGWEWALPGKNP